MNELIACCDDATWTPYTLVIENVGDRPVVVRARAVLVHDDLAVMVHGAESGTREGAGPSQRQAPSSRSSLPDPVALGGRVVCRRRDMRREYDFRGARRGALDPTHRGKTRITIRLDDDVLEWFRGQVEAAGGGNYQTLINAALREYMNRSDEPLEEVLRRVFREELDRSG